VIAISTTVCPVAETDRVSGPEPTWHVVPKPQGGNGVQVIGDHSGEESNIPHVPAGGKGGGVQDRPNETVNDNSADLSTVEGHGNTENDEVVGLSEADGLNGSDSSTGPDESDDAGFGDIPSGDNPEFGENSGAGSGSGLGPGSEHPGAAASNGVNFSPKPTSAFAPTAGTSHPIVSILGAILALAVGLL